MCAHTPSPTGRSSSRPGAPGCRTTAGPTALPPSCTKSSGCGLTACAAKPNEKRPPRCGGLSRSASPAGLAAFLLQRTCRDLDHVGVEVHAAVDTPVGREQHLGEVAVHAGL